MRALVLLALAAAAADVTVGTDDEPTPVKTADKLRAALAKGDPVIELGDDILLDGAPAVATRVVDARSKSVVLRDTGGVRLVWCYGPRDADDGEDQDRPCAQRWREGHVNISGALLLSVTQIYG